MAVTAARVQVRNQHRYFPSRKEGFQNDFSGTVVTLDSIAGFYVILKRSDVACATKILSS